MSTPTGPIIDVHAHCIPSEILDRLRADGHEMGITIEDSAEGTSLTLPNGNTYRNLNTGLTDTAARVQAMDDTGVDMQILSPWIDFTAYSLENGARYSAWFNESLMAEAAKAPGRFLAVGTVPLQDPAAAIESLDYAVNTLGMVGIEIASRVNDTPLENAGLDEFWAEVERLDVMVLVHPLDPIPGVDLKRRFMHNIVGRPAETTITLAGLILGGVMERFPGLKICAVHGGGFAPFQIGRLNTGYENFGHIVADAITKPPIEFLKKMWVDTVVNEPAVMRFLVDLLGPDRIVVGSDYPFGMGDLDPVNSVKNAGLDEAVVNAILYENAVNMIGAARVEAGSAT